MTTKTVNIAENLELAFYFLDEAFSQPSNKTIKKEAFEKSLIKQEREQREAEIGGITELKIAIEQIQKLSNDEWMAFTNELIEVNTKN